LRYLVKTADKQRDEILSRETAKMKSERRLKEEMQRRAREAKKQTYELFTSYIIYFLVNLNLNLNE
jgi:hypothetical protein